MNLINLIKQLYIEYKASNATPYLASHPELGIPIGIFNTKDEPTYKARVRSIKRMGIKGNLNSYNIALSLGICNPIPSFVAGTDYVYPLITGGTYYFSADGSKINFIGGSSEILPKAFHDQVNMVGPALFVTGSAKVGGGNDQTNIRNFIRFGYETTHTVRFYTDATEDMRLDSTGDLHVDGDVIAYSATISDYRLKENIMPLAGSLNVICNLQGVKFDWKHRDEKDQVGLIAQNVEQVIPEAITEKKLPYYSNEDGKEYKTIKYEMIIPHLIESIKELKTEIDSLKMRLGDS